MSAVCAAGAVVYSSGGLIDRPINRSDAARLVDYYERMRKSGLADAYRRECDFMDWQTEHTRDAIDPSCTAPGRAHTVLLWGDSFAQALSLGLRESLPAGHGAGAGDDLGLPAADRRLRSVASGSGAARRPTSIAMASHRALRPDVVVIAQSGGHAVTDWPALTARVLALGARHVIVVGPFPLWRPGLPRVYAEHHLQDHADYVGTGLDTSASRTIAPWLPAWPASRT